MTTFRTGDRVTIVSPGYAHGYAGETGVVVRVLPADHYDHRKLVVRMKNPRLFTGNGGLLHFVPSEVRHTEDAP